MTSRSAGPAGLSVSIRPHCLAACGRPSFLMRSGARLFCLNRRGPAHQLAEFEDLREPDAVFAPLLSGEALDVFRADGLVQAEIGRQEVLDFLDFQTQPGQVAQTFAAERDVGLPLPFARDQIDVDLVGFVLAAFVLDDEAFAFAFGPGLERSAERRDGLAQRDAVPGIAAGRRFLRRRTPAAACAARCVCRGRSRTASVPS